MKKETNISKAEIKKAWLRVILGILFFGTIIPYGIYENKKQEQMFRERGVVTAATILRSGGKYVEFQYEVNGQVYNKTKKKPYVYEFIPGKKYKLVYDPLDPETAKLCRDENKQYFLIEDYVKHSEKQPDKVESNESRQQIKSK
ncbi:DUF3592 domain-containing protein [Coprobacter sp.]